MDFAGNGFLKSGNGGATGFIVDHAHFPKCFTSRNVVDMDRFSTRLLGDLNPPTFYDIGRLPHVILFYDDFTRLKLT